MYSLTLNFNTKEELISYLNGEKNEEKAEVAVVKKAAKAKKAEEVQELPPKIEEAPKNVFVAPEKQAEPFDRDGALKQAAGLIQKIKALNIADDAIMPIVHGIYNQIGADLSLKVSQFDDVVLAKFLPMFEAKVASLEAEKNKAPVSFI